MRATDTITANLGHYQSAVDAALHELDEARAPVRIWEHDHTLWQPDPTELADRLGWLRVADEVLADLPRIRALRDELHAEGYTHALLLGMGGSSLAPEVFRRSFGVGPNGLDLAVLDSTHPDAIRAWLDRLDLARTLFIVSTKSGGTVETLSFFKFFFNQTAAKLGAARAGEHFIAITDAGSALAATAADNGFRASFFANPEIGGRYSAMSHFGIVPATLTGVDARRLLERAQAMAAACGPAIPAAANPGMWLGAVLGELAVAGRDKATFVTSPGIASFGDWVEQLIAESTGKEGKGILPVVGEALLGPESYRDDRLFIQLCLAGDNTVDAALDRLAAAGHPVIRLSLDDPFDLGGQMFLWEFATAVAGARLGINPFNQPNVESAKVVAREMTAAYQREGALPELTPTLTDGGITVYGDTPGSSPVAVLRGFLAAGEPDHGYIALQAYVPPTRATDRALQELRTAIQQVTRGATTTGYGPRFLHSTGQLHKGDAGHGLFIQFTSTPSGDAPIPDDAGGESSSITFGILVQAQSLGDRRALLDAGRRVLRFDLGDDVVGGLERLRGGLS